jgi:aryl-alcohol dehydrogenase-like predicted oxidoreductase
LSEASAATVRRGAKVAQITALQSEYSLWTRDYEADVIPACRENGIGFVAYAPLGRGFLTGQIKRFEDIPEGDFRRNSPRFQGANFQKNLDLVEKIKAMAAAKGCTPGQLAIAWVLAQGDDIVPIPGTKRVAYLDENLGALEVKLSAEDLRALDAIAPKGAFAGERYPASALASVNR